MSNCDVLQNRGEDIVCIDVATLLLANDEVSGKQGTIPFPSLQIPDRVLLDQRMTCTHTCNNPGNSITL